METILARVTKVVRRRRILQNQHLAVKERIKIAKDRNKDIDPEIHKWLENATNLLEKEQNFLELYRGRTLHSYNYQEAEDIADEIDMLVRKGKFDIISDLQSEIVDRQPKMLEGLESRMSIFREIMEALRDNDVGLTGVLGTAGVGKTTIVVEAGRYAAEQEGFFDVTVFSVVSDAPHAISKIQFDIAKDLDIPLDPEESESERARKIYEQLTSGERKVLIILDDVWEWLDLKSIGIPTKSGRRPVLCKVLLTSRIRIEWSTDYKTKTISVGTLPNEEALLLFNKIVGEIDAARYPDLGRRIVESFDGVPLVIAAVANLLAGRSLSEWTRAVKTLSIDKIFSYGPSSFCDHGIFSSFKSSYDHLRNEEEKFIFLLSSIFGGQIDREDLLKYALGLGLFQGADTARGKIYDITSSLKQSSLLEDGKTSRYVTMNETIRNLAFALAVASRADGDCFIVGKNSWELLRTDDVAKFGHIFLQISDDTQELPQGLFFPNLKLLRVYDENRSSKNIPDEFFLRTEGGLRVLALINMKLLSLPRVPGNLDTLCLDYCELRDISTIGELGSLRVLSLSHTSIKQLPQKIGQLTGLCLLDLSYCSELKMIPPGVLSSLTQLEDLRMENSFTNWVAESDSDKSNASLAELTSLENLTALNIDIPDAKMIPNAKTWDRLLRYNIKIGDDFPCASEWDVSKVLKLNNSKGSIDVSEPWIKSLWKSCEGLCMKEFKGLKNLNVELSGKLAYLHIEDHDELEFAFNLPMHECPFQLSELEITRCKKMTVMAKIDGDDVKFVNGQPLIKGQVTQAFGFSHLHALRLQDLDCFSAFFAQVSAEKQGLAAAIPGSKHLKLIGLPGIENLVELTTIDQAVPMANWETMEIKDCDGLRCLFIIKDVESDKTYGGQGLLFELRQLCLRNLTSFTSIIDGEHPPRILNFKLLNQLTVNGCNQLKYLLPLDVLNNNLEHLQNLDISDCANLEQVFVIDEGAVAIMSNTMVIPVLRSLKLCKLPKLASICHETCRIICRCLKQMTIEECPNLAFTFAHIEEKYRSMYYNREMITVPSVKNLNLRQLNHLKKMCKDRLVNFKLLTSLQLDKCNYLEYLFPLSVAQGLSSLQELQIISCQRVEQIVIKEKEGKQIVIEEKEGEQIVIKEKEETDSKKAIVKFPLVQTLILKNLPKFTRFCQDGCSVEWPSLKTVEVVKCPKILKRKSLGKTNKHLLEVISCNQWEENDVESNINHLFDSINELEVTIEGSEQLKEYINKMEDRQSLFSQLKKLNAVECDEELNKFLCTLHRRSHGLEELSVENCQLLEQGFDLGEFSEKKEYQPPTQTGGSDEKKQFDGTERSYNPGKRNSKHQPPTQTGEILEEEEHYRPKSRFFNRVTRDSHHQPPTQIITKLHLGESDEEEQSNRTTGCLNIGRRNSQRQPPTQTRPKVDLGESDKEKQSNRTTRRLNKGRRKSRRQPRTKTRRNVDPGESDAREEGNGLFPNLHTIRLSDLPELNCIWNEGPNGIVELGQLAKLEIIKCGLRKSLLLSTALVKKLENLEELNIDSCEMIVEVVGEEMEKQERSFPKLKNLQLVNLPSLIKFNFGLPKLLSLRIENCSKMDAFTTGFLSMEGPTIEGTSNHMVDENMDVCPELEELKLVGLGPFEEIWLGCVSTESVCKLRKLEVDTLSNLKYIFRSSMLPKLEKLVVRNCELLRNIVFPFSAEKNMELKLPKLRELVLSCLPKLEHVFKIDSMMIFENLEILQIKSCVSLQKLLLSSSCLKLSELEISDCNTLEEIFIERGEQTSLPNLETIVLENLPKLSSFFQETFEFPLLKEVRIVNCPALPTFSRNVSPTADSFFSDMDSIENLEEPAQDSSSNTLKRLQKLKKITVQRCDPLLVLFGINEGSPSGATELLPLKQEPKIPVFSKLTSLEIMRCGSIKIVFSISVAEHLTELKLLKLYDCENVEQVLQGGRKNSEVVFPKLECLILKRLPKLTSFCEGEFDFEFPELKEVRVWNIPEMNTFVKKSPKTPNLKEVYVTYINKCWQGDLNQTITYWHRKQDQINDKLKWKSENLPEQACNGNSFRFCTAAARSSSLISEEQVTFPSEESEVFLNHEELRTS